MEELELEVKSRQGNEWMQGERRGGGSFREGIFTMAREGG
jgi:hypothetical protein